MCFFEVPNGRRLVHVHIVPCATSAGEEMYCPVTRASGP